MSEEKPQYAELSRSREELDRMIENLDSLDWENMDGDLLGDLLARAAEIENGHENTKEED